MADEEREEDNGARRNKLRTMPAMKVAMYATGGFDFSMLLATVTRDTCYCIHRDFTVHPKDVQASQSAEPEFELSAIDLVGFVSWRS